MFPCPQILREPIEPHIGNGLRALGQGSVREDLLKGRAPCQSRSLTLLGEKARPVDTRTQAPEAWRLLCRWQQRIQTSFKIHSS